MSHGFQNRGSIVATVCTESELVNKANVVCRVITLMLEVGEALNVFL